MPPDQIATKYIKPSGRTAKYDRSSFVDDLMTAGLFLVWAESEGAYFGGHEASDAFRAMCRLLDIDPRGLRKALDAP